MGQITIYYGIRAKSLNTHPKTLKSSLPSSLCRCCFLPLFPSQPTYSKVISSLMDKLHPTLIVTNILNFIPVKLEMKNSQYATWSELFKIHCRAFEVIDLIIPPSSSSLPEKDKEAATKATMTPQLQARLEALVLQWIYTTISNDLLNTIIKPNTTPSKTWEALAGFFQDNKNTRVVYLEHQFNTTRMDSFSNITDYCQALKVLADQLDNVGAPISNQRLVLQLVAGLNAQYDGIGMLLQQTNPLPDFYEARSKLILEST